MSENISTENLSKLTIFSKYAKYIPELNRRESWKEICARTEEMHIKKYPNLKKEIKKAFEFVVDKKVVPSMRSMQFAGKPIEVNNSRIFNCAFTAIQTWKDFSEIMLLLLGGAGVGFSVQEHHINKLPKINKPKRSKKFLIGDSIEGWADSVRALFKSYMGNGYLPLFDYSDIRPKGAQLITAGGKAPGPEPLERCLNKIKVILDSKEENDKLTSIEVHDIVCIIADAVLSGGIRRAALISFFDKNDTEMLNCKGNFKVDILNGGFHYNDKTKTWTGEVLYKNKAHYISLNSVQFDLFLQSKSLPWYWFEPQRARANNSVVLLRNDVTEEQFNNLWNIVKNSGSGEPGFFWTDDKDILSNPCVTGDTLVLTNIGWIKIKNLEKYTDVTIITADKDNIKYNSKLEWVGLTKSDDDIVKISFDNGEFILTNKTHKLYLSDFLEKTVDDLQIGDIIKGKTLLTIIAKEYLDYKEDVYDLTANPNYNFYSILNRNEKIIMDKIVIEDDDKIFEYNHFDIVNLKTGIQKFAYQLVETDEILK